MNYVSLGANQQVCGLHCLQFCQISFCTKDCDVLRESRFVETSKGVNKRCGNDGRVSTCEVL